MSPILTALKEPTALIELAAALVTACYMARVTFSAGALQNSLRRQAIIRPVSQPIIFGGDISKDISRKRSARSPFGRSPLARLFAVGEAITIRKRSLRGQFFRLR